MPPSTRTKFQRERDMTQTASMYLQGVTQFVIAQKIGVAQSQISRDLKVIQRRWQQSAMVDLDAVKAKELARIDEVERQAYKGWRRSLRNADVTVKTARQKGDDKEYDVRDESKGQAGDPRFLTIVLQCVERRCKIFGVDAAIKVSWEEQAKADGYDPEVIVSGLQNAIFTALVSAGSERGLSEGGRTTSAETGGVAG